MCFLKPTFSLPFNLFHLLCPPSDGTSVSGQLRYILHYAYTIGHRPNNVEGYPVNSFGHFCSCWLLGMCTEWGRRLDAEGLK
jgi:hypothetical protein